MADLSQSLALRNQRAFESGSFIGGAFSKGIEEGKKEAKAEVFDRLKLQSLKLGIEESELGVKQARNQLTIDQAMLASIPEIGARLGQAKTTQERFDILREISPITATPQGARIFDGLFRTVSAAANAEAQSDQMILRNEYNQKFGAFLAEFGISPDDPQAQELYNDEVKRRREFQPTETILPSGVIQIEESPGQFKFIPQKSGQEVIVSPDGTVSLRPVIAGQAGSVTTGTRAKLEQQSISLDTGLSELRKAIQDIESNPTAIGPLGKVLSSIETMKSILAPSQRQEAPITKTIQQATLAFTQIADVLRVDSGNMSLYERRKLEDAGDVTGLFEGPQTALDKFNNLQRAMIGKQLRNLKTRGIQASQDLLSQIEQSEVVSLVTSGLLSRDEFLMWDSLQQP